MGPPAVSAMPLVLAALRDALRDLSQDPASEALSVRIEALALLLQQPLEEMVPPALDALTLHLADFGAFLQRSLANPSALASLAGPAAELCVAWSISMEAVDALRPPLVAIACPSNKASVRDACEVICIPPKIDKALQ